jgi:hypothetical protein
VARADIHAHSPAAAVLGLAAAGFGLADPVAGAHLVCEGYGEGVWVLAIFEDLADRLERVGDTHLFGITSETAETAVLGTSCHWFSPFIVK